jgi:hypothetical protein
MTTKEQRTANKGFSAMLVRDAPSVVLTNHSYRSFESWVDTLKKYELNHLFVKEDTILFEHRQDYYTIRK